MISEPKSFVSHMTFRERSTMATSSSLSRLSSNLNDMLTQKRNIYTDHERTESEGEASEVENRKIYINNNGEEIVFSQ